MKERVSALLDDALDTLDQLLVNFAITHGRGASTFVVVT